MSSSTSEIIATYLSEEKERSKRRLNVIVHNTEKNFQLTMDRR